MHAAGDNNKGHKRPANTHTDTNHPSAICGHAPIRPPHTCSRTAATYPLPAPPPHLVPPPPTCTENAPHGVAPLPSDAAESRQHHAPNRGGVGTPDECGAGTVSSAPEKGITIGKQKRFLFDRSPRDAPLPREPQPLDLVVVPHNASPSPPSTPAPTPWFQPAMPPDSTAPGSGGSSTGS